MLRSLIGFFIAGFGSLSLGSIDPAWGATWPDRVGTAEVQPGEVTRGKLPLSRAVLQRLQEAVDGVSRLLAGGGGGPKLVEGLARRLERAAAEPAAEGAEAPVEGPAPVEPQPQTPPHPGTASAS